MCILLKLHYAKFDVTRLFCYNLFSGVELSMRSFFVIIIDQTLSKKTLWGVGSTPPPPLGKGRVKFLVQMQFLNN